mmetsp:Transcript_70678/g.216619  ORF Transcript_70678/g.216619 Transcript_70678/m.216619 type:complete len:250 (+) Transcript_70678:397-1146(+)
MYASGGRTNVCPSICMRIEGSFDMSEQSPFIWFSISTARATASDGATISEVPLSTTAVQPGQSTQPMGWPAIATPLLLTPHDRVLAMGSLMKCIGCFSAASSCHMKSPSASSGARRKHTENRVTPRCSRTLFSSGSATASRRASVTFAGSRFPGVLAASPRTFAGRLACARASARAVPGGPTPTITSNSCWASAGMLAMMTSQKYCRPMWSPGPRVTFSKASCDKVSPLPNEWMVRSWWPSNDSLKDSS